MRPLTENAERVWAIESKDTRLTAADYREIADLRHAA